MLQEKFIGIKYKGEEILAIGLIALNDNKKGTIKMGKHQNAPNLNALLGEGDIPDDAIYYPEYDKAIVGFTTKGQVVYDVDACVQVLVDDNDMGYEEATEYFWFNTEGAHFGNMTPVFISLRGNFSG